MNRQPNKLCTATVVAMTLTLNGRVQGIGLRPAVARWAKQLGLTGYVTNTNRGVEVFIQGPNDQVFQFVDELVEHLPEDASIEKYEQTREEVRVFSDFTIAESNHDVPLATQVPPDIGVCEDCLAEIQDPNNRRSNYPFTSCTNCGPRYSIIQAMPYERASTSMVEFPLCRACQEEYESTENRRFHAQTNACPNCGPRIWCTDANGRFVAHQQEAITAATVALRQGEIVALRGLGGYQLLVDATNESAVKQLRQRKHRYGKPLAVMVASLEAAEQYALLRDSERATLSSRATPIVLCPTRGDSPLAPCVHPGLNTIGLMLPTTPLHALLIQQCRFPLVVTSANREGEPIIYQQKNLQPDWRSIADLWLEHNREIERPIDDSVVRWIAGRSVTIRLARGLAPLPLNINSDIPLFALGGHQKTALALNNGYQSLLGPHIGDLSSLPTCERYQEQFQSLKRLYDVSEYQLVCDQHPEYFTSQWAERQSVPVEKVQHHHAHIVAGMLEHNWLGRQVLGVAFDGTGWGDDHSIWGGEFLLSTSTSYNRVAHLRPFRLPGGDRAVREPWRVAVSLVTQAIGKESASRLQLEMGQTKSLTSLLSSAHLSPLTSSAGRLFDGVAALVMGIKQVEFEGQAAMLLEAISDYSEPGCYEFLFHSGTPMQLDWRPLIEQIVHDREAGLSPGVMAMRFHRGLARAIARICRQYTPLPVVLGGGVFQNRCLVELVQEEMEQNGQPCGLPGVIPSSDGGLAAGQLAVAAARASKIGAARCV